MTMKNQKQYEQLRVLEEMYLRLKALPNYDEPMFEDFLFSNFCPVVLGQAEFWGYIERILYYHIHVFDNPKFQKHFKLCFETISEMAEIAEKNLKSIKPDFVSGLGKALYQKSKLRYPFSRYKDEMDEVLYEQYQEQKEVKTFLLKFLKDCQEKESFFSMLPQNHTLDIQFWSDWGNYCIRDCMTYVSSVLQDIYEQELNTTKDEQPYEISEEVKVASDSLIFQLNTPPHQQKRYYAILSKFRSFYRNEMQKTTSNSWELSEYHYMRFPRYFDDKKESLEQTFLHVLSDLKIASLNNKLVPNKDKEDFFHPKKTMNLIYWKAPNLRLDELDIKYRLYKTKVPHYIITLASQQRTHEVPIEELSEILKAAYKKERREFKMEELYKSINQFQSVLEEKFKVFLEGNLPFEVENKKIIFRRDKFFF